MTEIFSVLAAGFDNFLAFLDKLFMQIWPHCDHIVGLLVQVVILAKVCFKQHQVKLTVCVCAVFGKNTLSKITFK